MTTQTASNSMAHVFNEDTRAWDERPDLTQCEYKTEKGRRCKLAARHENDHRMILRSEISKPPSLAQLRKDATTAKTFKGFTLSMQAVPVTENVSREYKREAEPRDEDQLRVDVDATANYEAWVKKGSPDKAFEDLGKMGLLSRYIFPPDAFDTVIAMLRRAAQSGGPVNGKRLSYRRKSHESGNAMVYFIFTDAKTKNVSVN